MLKKLKVKFELDQILKTAFIIKSYFIGFIFYNFRELSIY